MRLLIALALSYLVGSIPTAVWIGRSFLGIDLREHGSGNMGATNAFRVLGKKVGITVLLLDMLKGLAPVILFPRLLGIHPITPTVEVLIGMAAVVGHVFSCFVNFRGGKGVATVLGAFLAIATTEMLVLLGLGVVIILASGYVSAAAITGAVLLPFFLYAFGRSALVVWVGTFISLMVIFRHRSNLRRLLAGTEMGIYGPRKAPGDDEPIPTIRSERLDSRSE